MNLWSYLRTTDVTSDKPNIDQNKVLKLSSTLQEKKKKKRKTVLVTTQINIWVVLTVSDKQSQIICLWTRFAEHWSKQQTYLNITSYLRCKGWVQFSSKVVGIQYEHPNHKCKKYHNKKDHKLEDVLYSPPKGNLQGPKTLICRQDICNPRKAKNDSNCIKAFRDDLGIRWEPLISSWKIRNTGVNIRSYSIHHYVQKINLDGIFHECVWI